MRVLMLILALVVVTFAYRRHVRDYNSDEDSQFERYLRKHIKHRMMEEKNDSIDRGHHHHHHGVFPLPPFLKHCTKEARKEYIKILMDLSLSRQEFYYKVEEWKKKQPEKIQKEVDKFNEFMKKHIEEMRHNATHTVQELPKILLEIGNIVGDMNMPRKEQFEKIKQSLKSTDHQTAELAHAFLRIFTFHGRRGVGVPTHLDTEDNTYGREAEGEGQHRMYRRKHYLKKMEEEFL